MTEPGKGLTREELEEQAAQELPDREEMSVIQGIQPMPPVPATDGDIRMPVDPAGPGSHQPTG